MFSDTHAHLDFEEFQNDLEQVVHRALQAGVTRIITIGTTVQGCRRSVQLAETYSPYVFAAVGIHPNEAQNLSDGWWEELNQLARHPRVVAIGECGLDYHRPPQQQTHSPTQGECCEEPINNDEQDFIIQSWKEQQAFVFRMQLELAARAELNVIIHQRDSWRDCINILEEAAPGIRAVFHCFSGTLEQARELLQRNHLLSFTGNVTFKKAEHIRAVVAQIPENSFMIETDCPFLAPVPHRGSRCEPAYVIDTAKKIAEIRGIRLEDVSRLTETTVDGFFKWKK